MQIYVKNPFATLFDRFHLGKDGLFMFGTSRCSVNTGIVFGRATAAVQTQARIWAESTGPGEVGHFVRHDDQDTMGELCNKDPAFESLRAHPRLWSTYIPDNCRGCNSSQLVVSHCTHGHTKIAAMKSCPGWWAPRHSTKEDNSYCAEADGPGFEAKCGEAHTV